MLGLQCVEFGSYCYSFRRPINQCTVTNLEFQFLADAQTVADFRNQRSERHERVEASARAEYAHADVQCKKCTKPYD